MSLFSQWIVPRCQKNGSLNEIGNTLKKKTKKKKMQDVPNNTVHDKRNGNMKYSKAATTAKEDRSTFSTCRAIRSLRRVEPRER